MWVAQRAALGAALCNPVCNWDYYIIESPADVWESNEFFCNGQYDSDQFPFLKWPIIHKITNQQKYCCNADPYAEKRQDKFYVLIIWNLGNRQYGHQHR